MPARFLPRGWESQLSGLVSERGVAVERGLAYGPHARHRLDIYHGRAARPDAPLVLFFYGGGWTSGERGVYAFVGSALAAKGVTTVIADYRLYPEVRFPEFCHDAALAYGWVLEQALAAGRRVVIMGHSAGAHIAALLVFDPVYRSQRALPKPAGLIGLSGPFAFDPTSWPSTAAVFASAPTADVARPVVQALNGKGPPTLLIHGGADEVVHPVAVDMLADALRSVGTPVTTRIYPRIGHSGLIMTFAQPLRWRAPLLGDVLTFTNGL